VDRLTLHRYSAVIAISNATRRALLNQYRLSPDRVVTIYPPVQAVTPLQGARRETAFEAVYIGGLLRRKNLRLAILGVAAARRRGVPVSFRLGGEGPERRDLERLAQDAGVGDCVQFLGHVDERSKAELLGSADVFLFPSSLEGFGLAAAEALSASVPVIALKRSSLPEVVQDGVSGLLLDHDDPESMANAIERLARNPQLGRLLGESGRQDVTVRFDPERASALVADLYQRVIERDSRP
jgi:glycosyltransferase involved in cell wall biosynthesis